MGSNQYIKIDWMSVAFVLRGTDLKICAIKAAIEDPPASLH